MAPCVPGALRVSAVPRWSHRDPVEGGNPFPTADTRYGTWHAATADARATLLQFDADLETRAQVTLDPAIYRSQLLDLAVGRFDVWARRGRSVVHGRRALRDYERWLDEYVENWLRYIAETCPRVKVSDGLRQRLTGRAAHWTVGARNAVDSRAAVR